MGFCAALALTLLVQLPLTTQASLPGGERAQLSADQLVYQPSDRVLVATGHTVLRTERLILRADALEVDEAKQTAHARGHVMFAAGAFAAVAEEATVDLAGQTADVVGGLFMQKRGVTPAQLFAATTQRELQALGETSIAVSGRRIHRISEGEFEVEGLSFTPCDCKPTDPSWRIESTRAQIKTGDRASLLLPVVYVFKVPVLAFPWLSLPITERATGLLIPKPTTSALNGFSLEQPVFVTLGPSWDLTFTPGYFFGAEKATPSVLDPKETPKEQITQLTNPSGIKGPRLLSELRYAPTEEVKGRATLGLLYDLLPVRDPFNPSPVGSAAGPSLGALGTPEAGRELVARLPRRRLRWEASWQHEQSLGHGWFDRVDAAAVSDGYYVKDVTADVLLRESQSLRSTASVLHRDEDTYGGLEVTLRQDLRWGSSLVGNDRAVVPDPITGELAPRRGPNTFDRLPNLHLGIPEHPLVGPLFASLSAEATRTAPLFALFGDEGTDGVFNPGLLRASDPAIRFLDPPCGEPGASGAPPPGGCTQGNGRFDGVLAPTTSLPGEREARDRIDLRPQLSASFALGDWGRLTSYAAWRQDLWRGELTGKLDARGYPLLGLRASTELSRSFGEARAVRHAISPSLELRAVPFVLGQAPFTAYDEIDAAIPPGGLAQAVAAVRQRLWIQAGGVVREVARLDLTQGLELGTRLGLPNPLGPGARAPALSDSEARLTLLFDRVHLDGLARYNFAEQRLGQLTASVEANDGAGGLLYLRFDHLVTDGSEAQRRGIDALVGLPSALVDLNKPETNRCDSSPVQVAEAVGFNPAPRQTALNDQCWEVAEQLVVGVRKQFGFGLGLSYEAIVQPLAKPYGLLQTQVDASYLDSEIVHPGLLDLFSQQRVGLSYGPACDCWRVEVHALLRPRNINTNVWPVPDFGVTFTLSRFGSFGAGH